MTTARRSVRIPFPVVVGLADGQLYTRARSARRSVRRKTDAATVSNVMLYDRVRAVAPRLASLTYPTTTIILHHVCRSSGSRARARAATDDKK